MRKKIAKLNNRFALSIVQPDRGDLLLDAVVGRHLGNKLLNCYLKHPPWTIEGPSYGA